MGSQQFRMSSMICIFFAIKKTASEPNLPKDCTAHKQSIDHALKVYMGDYCRFSNMKNVLVGPSLAVQANFLKQG